MPYHLKPPAIITARLMCGVKVGDAYISIEPTHRDDERRVVFRYFIDFPDGTEHADCVRSGVGAKPDVQNALATLLTFLGAAEESYAHRMRTDPTATEPDPDGNEGLFPPRVTEWAYQYSDEISMLGIELEETPGLITFID